MDFSLQKEVEIYRMNNSSFWKMESEMQKTEIQKNEVQSSSKDEMARQILSVTEILIAEIGIQNLSMRKIATRANLALGTLYLYFKTKDDLLKSWLMIYVTVLRIMCKMAMMKLTRCLIVTARCLKIS